MPLRINLQDLPEYILFGGKFVGSTISGVTNGLPGQDLIFGNLLFHQVGYNLLDRAVHGTNYIVRDFAINSGFQLYATIVSVGTRLLNNPYTPAVLESIERLF